MVPVWLLGTVAQTMEGTRLPIYVTDHQSFEGPAWMHKSMY